MIHVYDMIWLVFSTPLKNISQWEGLSHILWKNKKCSKPPTSIYTYICIYIYTHTEGIALFMGIITIYIIDG